MSNNMNFQKNLRVLRRANGISQNELAEELGYKSFTTVQKWEDGTSFPKVENLNKLATIFNVDLDDLLNADFYDDKKVSIPVLGEVKAGYDMYADQNILGFEYVNESDCKRGDYFYLRVKGDSMVNERIQEGDVVYVRRQNYLSNNDIGVFVVDNSEVTVKRFSKGKNKVILKAGNPEYPDREFKEDEVKVLGKVLYVKIKL